MRIRSKQAHKASGTATIHKKEQLVTAVITAQNIPDSLVRLPDSTAGIAHVISMRDVTCKYQVSGAGTATTSCSCPQGHSHYICKHMVKVVSIKTFGLDKGYPKSKMARTPQQPGPISLKVDLVLTCELDQSQ